MEQQILYLEELVLKLDSNTLVKWECDDSDIN